MGTTGLVSEQDELVGVALGGRVRMVTGVVLLEELLYESEERDAVREEGLRVRWGVFER